MGNFIHEDTIVITCSPVKKIDDTEFALVNISSCDDETSKYCGIQIPQLFVSYNRGFTDDEINELVKFVSEESKSLWLKALYTEPHSDIDGDVTIV